ncbi:TPA: hypothetical protein L3526_004403 [Escherichia coli]|nr:hypothetical protein [Escherichia coli]
MSFELNRTRFLQVFAVMQSIKMINAHTYVSPPGILWSNVNIDREQFPVLIELIFSTPTMPNVVSLPSGGIAPILINPFTGNNYMPHSGPAFVCVPEAGIVDFEENVVFDAIERHISVSLTNLIRLANKRADRLPSTGDGFVDFSIKKGSSKYDSSELHFMDKEGDETKIKLQSLPRIMAVDSYDSRELEKIMRNFIVDSAKYGGGKVITKNERSADSSLPAQKNETVGKSFESRLLENPLWGAW